MKHATTNSTQTNASPVKRNISQTKNAGDDPPGQKESDFCCRKGNGARVDKTDSRAHVMGVVYMADERKPEVKKITRSKPYKEIEKDLRDQLEANGTYGKFFEDMIADYMAMYVTKTLLIADIQKRGTIVEYNNGGGQSGYKKNEAVDMFNKTNAQMLKLLSELGLKANATIGGGDFDDEL